MPTNVPGVDTVLSTEGTPAVSVSGNVNATGADILLIWVRTGDDLVPNGVSFNGVPADFVDNAGPISLFMLEAPDQTTALLTIQANAGGDPGGIQIIAGVVGFSDYDTVIPLTDFVSGTNAELEAISTPAVTGTIDDLLVGMGMMIDVVITSDAGQTELINIPESVHQAGFLALSVAQKTAGANVTLTWTCDASFGDNWAVGVILHGSGAPAGPSIDNVDTDNVITSTQETWNVNGSGFDGATVEIRQGTVVVQQTINAQNATTINCDTVFDSGAEHLKYGAATLAVINSDLEEATQAINIAAPDGREFVDLVSINPDPDLRITAIPDLSVGDQLEIFNVTGGTIVDVSVNDDATFDVSETVISFDVRAWDADDHTWGAAGTQEVSDGDTPNPFTFDDQVNVPPSTVITSNTITIAGLGVGVSVPVSVSGAASSQYSKNGGAFTSVAGTAEDGDTFAVRHTSSASYLTATNTTLTVGGTSDTFTSTTFANAGPTFQGPSIENLTLVVNVAMSPRSYASRFTDIEPMTFTLQGGAVTGLTLSSGGVLSGTPTVLGTYTGRFIRADDGSLTGDSNLFTISVVDTPPEAGGTIEGIGIEGTGIEGSGIEGAGI